MKLKFTCEAREFAYFPDFSGDKKNVNVEEVSSLSKDIRFVEERKLLFHSGELENLWLEISKKLIMNSLGFQIDYISSFQYPSININFWFFTHEILHPLQSVFKLHENLANLVSEEYFSRDFVTFSLLTQLGAIKIHIKDLENCC